MLVPTALLMFVALVPDAANASEASSSAAPVPAHRVHATPSVLAGLKGGCLGGMCGACLGFGLPGMCLGGILGWYIDDLQSDRDELESRHEAAEDAARTARQSACRRARDRAPAGSPTREMDCGGESGGMPFGKLALGVAGTGAAGLTLVLGVVMGVGAAAVGVLAASEAGVPAVAGAGLLAGAGLIVVGLVLANVVAAALWGPFGVWFVTDRDDG